MKTTISTLLSPLRGALAGLLLTVAASGCTTSEVGTSGAAVSGAGDTCVASSDCTAGLECEHGTCQPHRNRGGADDNGDHAEPGDDNGDHAEPGDDNGDHAEPGDDNGGANPDAGIDDKGGGRGGDGAGHR
jgi:hypothetical protein